MPRFKDKHFSVFNGTVLVRQVKKYVHDEICCSFCDVMDMVLCFFGPQFIGAYLLKKKIISRVKY